MDSTTEPLVTLVAFAVLAAGLVLAMAFMSRPLAGTVVAAAAVIIFSVAGLGARERARLLPVAADASLVAIIAISVLVPDARTGFEDYTETVAGRFSARESNVDTRLWFPLLMLILAAKVVTVGLRLIQTEPGPELRAMAVAASRLLSRPLWFFVGRHCRKHLILRYSVAGLLIVDHVSRTEQDDRAAGRRGAVLSGVSNEP